MGGKSSSKSSSSTTYMNEDRRAIADNGALAITGDGTHLFASSQTTTSLTDSRSWTDNSSTTINTLDGGAIKQSADVVRAALQTVEKSDAVAGEGFGKLLELAGDVLAGGATALERSQELTAQAYRESVETRQATIDNKTITVIAIAGAVAAVAYGASKR